jgi:hypothetical protein
MNLWTGPGDITMTADYKHAFKRMYLFLFLEDIQNIHQVGLRFCDTDPCARWISGLGWNLQLPPTLTLSCGTAWDAKK